MKTKIVIAGLLLALPVFYACESASAEIEEVQLLAQLEAEVDVEIENAAQQLVLPGFTTDPSGLTQDEIDGLLLMREEEGLAKDVYLYFYDQYKLRIFSNIAKAETQHASAVLRLLTYFNLEDPATGATGTFTNQHMQELYTQLTQKGATLNDALAVGAFIEEYDILDLKKLIEETSNTDIIRVYSNLLRGSTFHLKAFTRLLKVRGVVYVPQLLTQEEYESYLK